VGAVVCHEPLQTATVSQPRTGFEPYSHSKPLGEQDVFAGTSVGHKIAGPPSTQSAVQPPLLLPLPPPPLLLPLLPPWPPLLLVLPPPPLLLLLPPPVLLPLLAPLLLPPPPLLLPLPASLPVVNMPPPQASVARISGTIGAPPHRNSLMTSPEERSVCQSHLRES
jgi:hypothetical protein